MKLNHTTVNNNNNNNNNNTSAKSNACSTVIVTPTYANNNSTTTLKTIAATKITQMTSNNNPISTTATSSSGPNDSKYKYRVEIQQMMFVSGETNDPPISTTSLIEDIVRGQVIEILMRANQTAHCRGSKNILPEDVIFLMRHDKAKVNRLRTYLSWKDLRKNAKDQDNNVSLGGTSGGPGGSSNDTHNPNNGAGDDVLLEDGKDKNAPTKLKKSTIKLPWELQFMFNEQPLNNNNDADDEDEDEREAHLETMKRLKIADDRTKNMTKEEYVHWSDCRQASFTFRKAKRFRDWSGLNHLTEGKPHDDVIDILGFLTFEIVCSLTETALKVKAKEERMNKQKERNNHNNTNNKKRKKHESNSSKIIKDEKQAADQDDSDVDDGYYDYDNEEGERDSNAYNKKRRKRLFDGPDNAVNPIKPKHIEESWRILQIVDLKHRALTNFKGGRLKTRPIIM